MIDVHFRIISVFPKVLVFVLVLVKQIRFILVLVLVLVTKYLWYSTYSSFAL